MIEKIEIQYFRSIYRMKINSIEDINVLTGKNDVGKSNVLKALNLFFNNCVVEQGDFDFISNYNLKRLEEVRKETIKGKQYIQIKVTFLRGNRYEKTLPERFTVSRKWNRDSREPQTTDDLEISLKRKGITISNRNRASLTRFLGKMQYFYIPAIKDKKIFDSMLHNLQNTVYSKKLSGKDSFVKLMSELYGQVLSTTEELSTEFLWATGIQSSISTPKEVDELYKTLHIETNYSGGIIPLEDRGDGIRVRYIPSILNYIACNSNNMTIWGFEEPENSLEFNRARQMANDFYNQYKQKCQIFLTTHSPAFIDLGTRKTCAGYRCYVKNNETKIASFKEAEDLSILSEELGYAHILQSQYEDFKRVACENEEKNKIIEELNNRISNDTKPIVLTEGKTDAIILKEAWKKLYDIDCPFLIDCCDLLGNNTVGGGAAGASVLNKILCGIRYDSNRIVIGMFDNDYEGKKRFRLDANYEMPGGKVWKQHVNKKGYAFIIPVSDDLKQIAENDNLSIEFLFDKPYLFDERNPDASILEVPDEKRIVNNRVVNCEKAKSDLWYCFKVKDSMKMGFATEVVPNLPKEAFSRFVMIFNIIKDILDTTKKYDISSS